MEIKINGYIKIKKTPVDIFGKHTLVPLEDSVYKPLFGKMVIDSDGDMTIVLGKESGKTDFVFVIRSYKEQSKESIIFNYTDINTGYNTICFEMDKSDKVSKNGHSFLSNECIQLNLCEHVETIFIENSVTEKGGTLKIKAKLTADIPLQCKLWVELAVVPQYNA